jgi:hypothetical protein
MKLKWPLVAFAGIVLVGIAFVLSDDINRVALVDYMGQQTSDGFAGVRIGDRAEVASTAFAKRGMLSAPYQDDGSCPITGKYDEILVFVDMSWRKGTICVGVTQGAVKAFAWRYNFLQP